MKLFAPRTIAIALVLAACSTACNTEECKALKAELEARRALLAQAKNQAAAFEPAKKRAMSAEGNANKLMHALGTDLPESQISKELSERVQKISTATVTREVISIGQGQQQGQVPEQVTQWAIRFDAKDAKAAFDVLALLLPTPPLFRFASLIREDKAKNRWRIELRRAVVDQIEINPKPHKLNSALSLTEIPSHFGMCGAGSIRSDIESVDAEIEKVRANAEALTIELPKAASYEGLRRRAERTRDEESETRDHLAVFEEALEKSGAKLKAIGVESSMSVLEIWGTTKDRAAVEKALFARGLGESLQPRVPGKPGIERLQLRNKTADYRLHPNEASPDEKKQAQEKFDLPKESQEEKKE